MTDLHNGNQPTDPSTPAEPTALGTEQQQPASPWRWYDLLYGILFQPVKTYRRVAVNPPLAITLALVVGLNLLVSAMNINTMEHYFIADHLTKSDPFILSLLQRATPYIALVYFILDMLWWLVFAAVLHLLAEFFGGSGRGITSFTVYGLAGLPAILLLPLQSLEIIFSDIPFFTSLATLGALAVTLWGIALLVIGLRETHQLSTGRAVLVLATPLLLLLVLLIILAVFFAGLFSSMLPVISEVRKL